MNIYNKKWNRSDSQYHRNTKEYKDQFYADKLDNLKEMEKFLETNSLPRLNQEEIKNMDRKITTKEIY